ncbi:putative uncharacterized protein [Sutterella sp. CAG:521]|nr:putative uncharacterized protein [Sutterella sp. CAG:521]
MDWRVLIAFFGSCVIIYCLGRTAGRFFGLDNTGKTIFGMAAIFGNSDLRQQRAIGRADSQGQPWR